MYVVDKFMSCKESEEIRGYVPWFVEDLLQITQLHSAHLNNQALQEK